MSQYALPNANYEMLGWVEGAGDADEDYFDELDEGFGAGRGTGTGPDDINTWWKTEDEASNYLTCQLQSVDDPGAHTEHKYRTRNCKNLANGRQMDATIRLYVSTTQIAEEIFSNINEVWTTREDTLSEAEAGNITDYTNLRIRCQIIEVGGGAPRVGRESAFEFECPDAGGQQYSIDAGVGSYSLAGSATGLLKSVLMSALGGSYALTGTAVMLGRAYTMDVGLGSYSLQGATIGLVKDMLMSAGAGSYTITGADANLLRALVMAAAAGSYAIAGQDVSLPIVRVITASGGSYTITGTAAGLIISLVMQALGSSYVVTGQDASLVLLLAGIEAIATFEALPRVYSFKANKREYSYPAKKRIYEFPAEDREDG